jgi:hypothetical protein
LSFFGRNLFGIGFGALLSWMSQSEIGSTSELPSETLPAAVEWESKCSSDTFE